MAVAVQFGWRKTGMKGKDLLTRVLLLSSILAALLLSSSAEGANQVAWSYNLSTDGGDQYTYTFDFSNLGLAKDAVFKVHIDGLAVPQQWATVSWSTPYGWTAQRADKYLDWQTGNGDIGSNPPDGYYRLWGQPGAPDPSPGWTNQTFGWTFTKDGGPTPTPNFFTLSDTKIFLQPIDDNWHNAGGSYTVNPIPEPSSLLVLGVSLISLLSRARRKLG